MQNLEMPSVDGVGVESAATLTRYRQGVVLTFRPAGKIYAFSYEHFFATIVNGLVMLGVAKLITDFIVFNVLPDGVSEVMNNKRAELVNLPHREAGPLTGRPCLSQGGRASHI